MNEELFEYHLESINKHRVNAIEALNKAKEVEQQLLKKGYTWKQDPKIKAMVLVKPKK